MAENSLPTTSFAVLGMLISGPASRYDIVRFAEISIANFWTIAKSQVYGELDRLEKMGLVKSKPVRQKGLPDKRLYEITSAGREAFDEWLADSTYEPDRTRSGFLVKLFYGANNSPENLREIVAKYKEGVDGDLERFAPMTESIPEDKEYAFMRVTALLGLRHLRSTLDWIVEDLEPLVKKSSSKRGRRTRR
ncbi:MAG: PadR family transcriptional regulator [Acidimicrobiia bacterium]